MKNYKGQCYCGKVQFVLQQEPLFAQYCHCNKCRDVMSQSQRESDKKGYAYTLACNTDDVDFQQGKEYLDGQIRNQAILYHCKFCDSEVYGIAKDPNYQQTLGLNGNNFEAIKPIPDTFKPIRHAYYVNKVVDDFESDGLPKFVDMPSELGGSGEQLS